MQRSELLIVFEKMYLQENDTKEKITIRVQLVFSLILALVAVSSYMLRMLDFTESKPVALSILVLVLVFLLCLGLSGVLAVRAFWGNTFKQMPAASEIKNYCNALVQYNLEVEAIKDSLDDGTQEVDIKSELDGYLSDAFEECATHNADVNFKRSTMVHQSFKWLLTSLIPLAISATLFVGLDMDVSSPRKNYQVIDKYVGDQLGKIDSSLSAMTESLKKLEGTKMSDPNTKKPASEQDSKAEPSPGPAKDVPMQMKPKLPDRPSVRISLEDSSGNWAEVKHDSGQE
ncbi:hypothetical protein ABDX87_23465 [Pseudomonas abietaniphila]|uniref:hypothetical protein n=1 Tax=Pseudomonas abietaniphila TaxID=89065 RepID=UPI00321670E5